MPWKYAAQSAIADVIPAQLLVESNYVNRILSSIAFTLLYYDFVLTFRQEVERYWSGTLSWPSFLFFLNRYMSIMSHIPVIVEFFGIIPESRCRQFQQYHRVISMVIQAVVAALLLLRTYALYGRDRRILKLLLAIVGVGAIISVWVIIKGHGAQRPTVMQVQGISQAGCDLTLSQEEGSELAIAWSAILVFDGTVVVLTLLQALKVGRAWRGGYYRVMLRDGTIYFGVLFVCYLSNILAYAVAEVSPVDSSPAGTQRRQHVHHQRDVHHAHRASHAQHPKPRLVRASARMGSERPQRVAHWQRGFVAGGPCGVYVRLGA